MAGIRGEVIDAAGVALSVCLNVPVRSELVTRTVSNLPSPTAVKNSEYETCLVVVIEVFKPV